MTRRDAAAGAELGDVGTLEMLTWPVFGPLGIDAAVTTRNGGTSSGPYRSLNLGLHVGDDEHRVVENRRRVADAFGAELSDLIFAAQVHGSRATVVDIGDAGRGARSLDDTVADCDALVTASPGIVLVMLVADCVPVILADPVAGVVACIHAGWRGTVARVLDSALSTMATLGGRAERTVAAFGPAIAAEHYQVGPEVADGLAQCLDGATDGVLAADGPGRWRADLLEANRRILLGAGVRHDSIHTTTWSTGPPGPFFSDRNARPCGRIGALVRLRP